MNIAMSEAQISKMFEYAILANTNHANIPNGNVVRYYGKFVINDAYHGFVLFDCCSYCGSKSHPKQGLDGSALCVNCGAPIDASRGRIPEDI